MNAVSQPAAGTPPAVDLSPLKNLKYDAPAGLVVFLVALPLCLGIALASGAPMFTGLIAGVVGGLIIPLISKSMLSVCGPAAGLAAIVVVGIQSSGSYQAFCMAVVIAGLLQAALGAFRAGALAGYIPGAVIKGMLAGIGVLLILKQVPVSLGWSLLQGHTLLEHLHKGAVLISAVALLTLTQWDRTPLRKVAVLPAALAVVVMATLMSEALRMFAPDMALPPEDLVTMPVGNILDQFQMPMWSALQRPDIWVTGVTIAIVATLESLLSIEAVDRLDPWKRRTPMNRELVAQGVGNALSGLLGGLPVTSVIIRSSTNVNAGGRTKAATMIHATLLALSVIFARDVLTHIPLAALACILIMTGYKLAHPNIWRSLYRAGLNQFVPFVVTVAGIVMADLLRGIAMGFIVALVFMVRQHAGRAYRVQQDGNAVHIHLNQDAYFFSKAALLRQLDAVPDGSSVVVDGSAATFVDADVREALNQFKNNAHSRNIQVEVKSIEMGVAAAGGH